MEAERAEKIAGSLLREPLLRRWLHTQGVARQARRARSLTGALGEVLEASAWLHDVGYSPALVETGFHPLDGARHLRRAGTGDEVVLLLVAHHSCARIEARERGLDQVLAAEFPAVGEDVERLLPILTWCDMTTNPTGRPVEPQDRLAEILDRYPEEDPVHRAIVVASPEILRQCEDVESALARAHQLRQAADD